MSSLFTFMSTWFFTASKSSSSFASDVVMNQISTMTTLLAHINSNMKPKNINQPTARLGRLSHMGRHPMCFVLDYFTYINQLLMLMYDHSIVSCQHTVPASYYYSALSLLTTCARSLLSLSLSLC